jgi:hypothetical protein
MELFQLKISPEGKLLDQGQGRLSLVDDDKDMVKTVSEINDASTEDSPSNSGTFPQCPYTKKPDSFTNANSFNNFSSPRSNPNIPTNDLSSSTRNQNSSEKNKLPFMRKNNTVEEVETTAINSSPVRKAKQGSGSRDIKSKSLKFHEEMIKGINIGRSMGLNHEKNTPLFSYYLFKNISERLRIFREE